MFVTFNGDSFDWPFVEARAKYYNLSIYEEIGVKPDKVEGPGQQQQEYKCRFGSHLDVFKWVMRDSYLPQGSQGLKVNNYLLFQY